EPETSFPRGPRGAWRRRQGEARLAAVTHRTAWRKVNSPCNWAAPDCRPRNGIVAGEPVPFCWDELAQRAFAHLKDRFALAPILVQPDLNLQFIVEVDASDAGVGAVLSQRQGGKLHPCAYFSRRLSSAESNYDVGDRELLAIKLALEEWRHWLEGAAQPFVVWTDHKNLEYIRSAKRLNARQARRPLTPIRRLRRRSSGLSHSTAHLCNRGSDLGDRVGHSRGSTDRTRPRNGTSRVALRPLLCKVTSVTLGSYGQIHLPPRGPPHYYLPSTFRLVAFPCQRRPRVYFCMLDLRLKQERPSTTLWPPPTSADSESSLVAHRC
ncbi:uncharacterized protein LOC109204085, partial [Oreochromis niloticus]|uniref:uncharacterized protein LOC109204085 n=1 Tax=Oreochromis niloticus TaxID=8128 RepID=UPI000DF294D7